ncbi:hypothetical protein BU14_0556s0003 [Porphyra umbilicalis]|uniref:Uncharacterized protein n=1 Tax=Porphyra umbilicalis TaxID=2786 RepID=A0A1X6NRV5_PORUM|nr:hypothetical protein BU14_0556s0003 [Porphyra umbilicalis]|eukprot:OSX71317.1 hypothetical protein BU14_0556s0003 [Porphyra umbilicalis]
MATASGSPGVADASEISLRPPPAAAAPHVPQVAPAVVTWEAAGLPRRAASEGSSPVGPRTAGVPRAESPAWLAEASVAAGAAPAATNLLAATAAAAAAAAALPPALPLDGETRWAGGAGAARTTSPLGEEPPRTADGASPNDGANGVEGRTPRAWDPTEAEAFERDRDRGGESPTEGKKHEGEGVRGVGIPTEGGKHGGDGRAREGRSTAGERRVVGSTPGLESSTEWARRVKGRTPRHTEGEMCEEGPVARARVGALGPGAVGAPLVAQRAAAAAAAAAAPAAAAAAEAATAAAKALRSTRESEKTDPPASSAAQRATRPPPTTGKGTRAGTEGGAGRCPAPAGT